MYQFKVVRSENDSLTLSASPKSPSASTFEAQYFLSTSPLRFVRATVQPSQKPDGLQAMETRVEYFYLGTMPMISSVKSRFKGKKFFRSFDKGIKGSMTYQFID
jgi:hypothetical protein